MEQPPGRVDDLQPQDLSTSSIPTVIDLTRKGEECVLSSTSLDTLRMVKSPGWYTNSAAGNPGLQFSGTGSSEVTLQSRDQIQPDNALSHTTVTLSYVSRSHVFSTHDSLSQHTALYSVPPISKFSLHPSCDADKGLVEAAYSHNQHHLQQGEGHVDLATQTKLLQSVSQAQVGSDEGCQVQELNGGVIPEIYLQEKGEHSRAMENGQGACWSSSGACAKSSPESLTPLTGQEREGAEVLLLMSKEPDPAAVSDRDLCSLSREYISPLEDPISPSATSLDDVEDVFVLPQASSSPSGDNSYLEVAEDVVSDGLSTEGAIQPNSSSSDGCVKLDSSDVNKQPANRQKAALEPLIDLTENVCVLDVSENKAKPVVPHINGNAKVLERTLKEKKLPSRSGRGVRLEAIVMNINSSKYKYSGCIRTNKKADASQSAANESTTDKMNDLAGNNKGRVKACLSVKTKKQKIPAKRGKTSNINTDSTSDSEINNSKTSHGSTPPKSPPLAVHKKSKKEPVNVVHPSQTSPAKSKRRPSSSPYSQKDPGLLPHASDASVETHVVGLSPPQSPPPSRSPRKSQGKAKSKAAGSKSSPTTKTKVAHTPKRRQKKHKQGQASSMFSPKEPEIKLKYVNYKEEKRDLRADSFSPFIHVERQRSSPSLCTVINYPEDVRTQHKKGQLQPAHTGVFISAVIPSTSCLQLGRRFMHSQHQRSLVCCLCGHSANAMDLGDLHGPYYPEGYQPSTKTPASASGLKEDEDDFSDSDSSSCSVRGRGRKRAAPPTPWALRPGGQLKKKGLLESQRWTGDGTDSPAAKCTRSDAGSAHVEDWYSPPMLPLEPCEYWLHEDCGIWSAGVFLVKGKVYGLEEAVKVAQETMCSACHSPGATLGCFFKGCPNKYHYRCSLESDCVLIEENFSMKCKKHKNKTFKAPLGNRLDDR